MEQGRKEKIFSIGLAGSAPGKSESFMVNLTSTKQADSLYQGDSHLISEITTVSGEAQWDNSATDVFCFTRCGSSSMRLWAHKAV